MGGPEAHFHPGPLSRQILDDLRRPATRRAYHQPQSILEGIKVTTLAAHT
jgi:hypothetical protein